MLDSAEAESGRLSPTLFKNSGIKELLSNWQIERIQNTTLWQSYQLMKKQLEVKNNHKNNERQLFHGTAAKSVDWINNRGFDRGFAGTHGNVKQDPVVSCDVTC